jgi:hypothetical protein
MFSTLKDAKRIILLLLLLPSCLLPIIIYVFMKYWIVGLYKWWSSEDRVKEGQ